MSHMQKSTIADAEARARAAGYRGKFPPEPRHAIATAEEFGLAVEEATAGDGRANLLAQIAVHTATFFDALTEERFTQLAEKLIEIAHDGETARRSQIRAVQAAVRPLTDLIRRIHKLQKTGATLDGALLDRLQRNTAAFLRVFARAAEDGKTELVRLADLLFEIAAARTGPKGREDQIRAIDTAMKMTAGLLDVLLDVQARQDRIDEGRGVEVDPDQAAATLATLRQIEREATAEMNAARGRKGDA